MLTPQPSPTSPSSPWHNADDRWQAIFMASPECISVIDAQGRWQEINPAGLALLDADASQQVLGHCVYPLVLESYRSSFQDLVTRVLAGEVGQLEFEIVSLNGTRRFIEMQATPLRDPQQTVIAVLGVMRDITARRQMETELRAVQSYHLQIFAQNARPMWFYDQETLRFLDVNQAALDAYGYSREEFLGMTIRDIRPPEDLPNLEVGLTLEARVRVAPRPFRHRKKDGTVFDVDVSSHDLTYARRPARLVVARDITAQKRTDELLWDSQTRMQSILTEIHDVIWSVAPDSGQMLYQNPAVEQVYGRPSVEFFENAELWREVIYPPDLEKVERVFEVVWQTGSFEAEYRIVRPNGQIRWLHDRCRLIRDQAGQPLRIDGIATDITERKRAEGLLDIQTRVLQRIALGHPLSAILHEITTLVELQYPGLLCSILLLSEDGQHLHCGAAASFPAAYNQAIEGMAIGPIAGSCGTAAYHKATVVVSDIANDPLWKNFRALALAHNLRACWSEPILSQTGQVLGTLAMYYADCRTPEPSELEASKMAAHLAGIAIERKRVETRLVEQTALLDQAQEAIISTDLNGRILYWNRGAEALYGWSAEEVLGRDIRSETVQDTQAYQHERGKMFRDGTWNGELVQRRKDGREIVIEGNWTMVYDEAGIPKAMLGINRDVTEKKLFESQFLRAQRLESIGTLASGIAHDLNNVLSPLAISVYLLRTRLHEARDVEMLNTMDELIERGGNMVQQVLAFVRGSSGERVVLNPKHVLREVVGILKDTLPKSITLKYSAAAQLHSIFGDPTQLHQAVMNLCVNARDAMPGGGVLTIAAENQVVDQLHAGMLPDVKLGEYVVITVTDTGEGIAPSIRGKIFDPFFTTKETGSGTGLGLSTALSIVQRKGGFISVYSEVGYGAQFKIYLPVHTATAPPADTGAPTFSPAGHGELILLIDDEPALCLIARQTLETVGYRVLTASNGEESLMLLAAHRGEVAAVILDMMMPGMDGPTTMRALQQMAPSLQIIASSALAVNDKLDEARRLGARQVLLKPYSAERLLQTLAEVIHPATS